MRMKIAHNRSKAAAVESVDREFNEMFKGVAGLPVRLVVKQKSWQSSHTRRGPGRVWVSGYSPAE